MIINVLLFDKEMHHVLLQHNNKYCPLCDKSMYLNDPEQDSYRVLEEFTFLSKERVKLQFLSLNSYCTFKSVETQSTYMAILNFKFNPMFNRDTKLEWVPIADLDKVLFEADDNAYLYSQISLAYDWYKKYHSF